MTFRRLGSAFAILALNLLFAYMALRFPLPFEANPIVRTFRPAVEFAVDWLGNVGAALAFAISGVTLFTIKLLPTRIR